MRLLTTAVLLFTFLSAFAQHSIKGKITDSENVALPYANIILYKVGSDADPKGTVSNDKGEYSFENIASGNYMKSEQ